MSLYQMRLAGFGIMHGAERLDRPTIADGQLVQLLPEHTALDDTAIRSAHDATH